MGALYTTFPAALGGTPSVALATPHGKGVALDVAVDLNSKKSPDTGAVGPMSTAFPSVVHTGHLTVECLVSVLRVTGVRAGTNKSIP